MLGQEAPYAYWDEYSVPGTDFATERAIAASQAGAGGTGGGAGQGQPESFTAPTGGGFWTAVTDAAGSVVSAVEAPFKAVGGVLYGVQKTGEMLPWILFGLGAVALVTFLPKGGVYRVAPRRRR